MAGGALAMVLNSASSAEQADSIALNMLQLHNQCEVWKPEMGKLSLDILCPSKFKICIHKELDCV